MICSNSSPRFFIDNSSNKSSTTNSCSTTECSSAKCSWSSNSRTSFEQFGFNFNDVTEKQFSKNWRELLLLFYCFSTHNYRSQFICMTRVEMFIFIIHLDDGGLCEYAINQCFSCSFILFSSTFTFIIILNFHPFFSLHLFSFYCPRPHLALFPCVNISMKYALRAIILWSIQFRWCLCPACSWNDILNRSSNEWMIDTECKFRIWNVRNKRK